MIRQARRKRVLMYFALSLSIIIFSIQLSYGQAKYSRIKIDMTNTSIESLHALGLETDHGFYTPGVHFVNEFSDKELALIAEAQISYRVLVDDVQHAYHNHKHESNMSSRSLSLCETIEEGYDFDTPENYTYGSMGGYHTFDQLMVVLDSMSTKFPALISERRPVEDITTWDGNQIWWLKLSDNPSVDEDEPQVLFTALHHAREPNGLSQMIFYIWYLLENYDTDEEVRYLVDNTEMYFMPCLNPDGYKHNELTDPNGGGFWRKNRRPAEFVDSIGVDLNRNYGYFWGFDDVGSSADPRSNVYRGPDAFSEPETQAVRKFALEHEFQIAMNYHTFGNLLIHPWGYNDLPTDEDALFKAIGEVLTEDNNYRLGTGTETVGYIVNGNSDDYLYGEQGEKNKIYAMTPEVGPRFWPQASEIDFLNKSVMRQNLNTAHCLLNYYSVEANDLDRIVTEKNDATILKVTKAGLMAGSATVTVVSTSSDLAITSGVFELDMEAPEIAFLNVPYVISDDVPALAELTFDVIVDNGIYSYTDSYAFTYKNSVQNIIYQNDLTSMDDLISDEEGWQLTDEDFVSGPTSLTDSPGGLYLPDTESYVTLMSDVDLTSADFASLSFQAKWDLERNYDYTSVQITSDGINWVSLCGKFTRPGILNTHGVEDPLYDGRQTNWLLETIDLGDFIGEIVQLRLVMVSDGFVSLDGFYIDDIEISTDELVLDQSDIASEDEMNVLPSITNGSFFVNVNSKLISDDTKLEIVNSMGQVVFSSDEIATRTQINLSINGLGVYFVRLINRNEMITRKVTIVR